MMAKFKEWCFQIATLGGLGKWYGGGILGALFAIPLLYALKAISALNQNLFVILLFVAIALTVLIIQAALHFQSDQPISNIIIDRVLGFLLVFLGNPLTIKFLAVGFVVFNFFIIIRPFIFNRIGPIDLRYLPGALSVVMSSVLAGVFVNLFFRLVLWLAH